MIDHAAGPALKLPPQNLECEVGVIGSVFCHWPAMGDVAYRLTPADFYRDTHQLIWASLLDLWAEGRPADQVIVGDWLQARGLLERVGGPGVLAEYADAVPHSASAAYYADIVKDHAVRRALIDAHTEGLKEAYAGQHTAAELCDRAERRLLAAADGGAKGDPVWVGEVMPAVMAAIESRAGGEVTGLSSGVSDLDEVTTGFQPGDLVYLAGRTSMGKTAFALNVIENLAVNQARPVLLLSLEMSRAQIVERLLVSRAAVDGHRVRTARLSADDRSRLRHAAAQIEAAPLVIDDSCGRTAGQIAGTARRFHSRHGMQMCVIDLINHVEGEDRRESRREQMCVISRRFKQLARELSVPVLVLAQLNRGPDQREGNRPRKSDLKECGNLEEDADVVLLLHRPDYYDPNDAPGQAVIIVDKNRNGPTRDVRVSFQKHLMRFDDLAPVVPGEGF